jgi:hypothetical protein
LRQELDSNLVVWLKEAMSLDQIKCQVLKRINDQIDKLCSESLPQLDIPVSPDLHHDMKLSMVELIDKACNGDLDPDGSIGHLIELSYSIDLGDYRGKIKSMLDTWIPKSMNVAAASENWQRWTKAKKLLYGRFSTSKNPELEREISVAENSLFSTSLCHGLLAKIQQLYSDKGYFKKLLLSPFDEKKNGCTLLQEFKDAGTEYWTAKEETWNAYMPYLIRLLRDLGLAQGEVLKTLEIFAKIRFSSKIGAPDRASTDPVKNRLFSPEGEITILPPDQRQANSSKDNMDRYEVAKGLEHILNNLMRAVDILAQEAADAWAEKSAPGILKVVFQEGLGLDIQAPARIHSMLADALKARLSKFLKTLASNGQVHFNTIIENTQRLWISEAEYLNPSGLKWEKTGEKKPTEGRDRSDPEGESESKLSKELRMRSTGKKIQFTQEEWDDFGISDLHDDDFIKSGDVYFKPAANFTYIDHILKEESVNEDVATKTRSILLSKDEWRSLKKEFFVTKWKEVNSKPTGEKIDDQKLAEALRDLMHEGWAEFSWEERKKHAFFTACGLNWEKTGEKKPTAGRELEVPKLVGALKSKTQFTKEEWNDFGISDLRYDDYIEVGNAYFKPGFSYEFLMTSREVDIYVELKTETGNFIGPKYKYRYFEPAGFVDDNDMFAFVKGEENTNKPVVYKLATVAWSESEEGPKSAYVDEKGGRKLAGRVMTAVLVNKGIIREGILAWLLESDPSDVMKEVIRCLEVCIDVIMSPSVGFVSTRDIFNITSGIYAHFPFRVLKAERKMLNATSRRYTF